MAVRSLQSRSCFMAAPSCSCWFSCWFRITDEQVHADPRNHLSQPYDKDPILIVHSLRCLKLLKLRKFYFGCVQAFLDTILLSNESLKVEVYDCLIPVEGVREDAVGHAIAKTEQDFLHGPVPLLLIETRFTKPGQSVRILE